MIPKILIRKFEMELKCYNGMNSIVQFFLYIETSYLDPASQLFR